jgi:hypothetical protein
VTGKLTTIVFVRALNAKGQEVRGRARRGGIIAPLPRGGSPRSNLVGVFFIL